MNEMREPRDGPRMPPRGSHGPRDLPRGPPTDDNDDSKLERDSPMDSMRGRDMDGGNYRGRGGPMRIRAGGPRDMDASPK
jgi:hypothetical protein